MSSVTCHRERNWDFKKNMSLHNQYIYDLVLTSLTSTEAPKNDLLLLKEIHNYSQVDSKVPNIAKIKIQGWYLSEDLAALPLFSDQISIEEKVEIVNALQKEPYPGDK